ncbi:MAG TPA: heavy-metal-associated domain-containing protein [Actinomycetota bacterium]|nr:heavy-metal-associated domain-containing protein [Actinomycetota bacterium]
MTTLRVPDATCGHCKQTVERAVGNVGGVKEAALDLESKTLVVRHDGTTSGEELLRAVAGAGYSPELVEA